MKISNTTRVWFFLALMIILTACGGSGDSKKALNPIDKIARYANHSSSGAPTLDDYLKAGITGVTISNIKTINKAIHNRSTNSVDTVAEIQSIVDEIRNIPVIKDESAPEIMLRGTNYVTLVQNETYTEKGAQAIDARDGKVEVVIGGSVDTTKVGTYIVTYTAVDKAGNEETEIRTIKVILTKDEIAPVIKKLNGSKNLTLEQGTPYVERSTVANDGRDGLVKVIITGSVDTSKTGTYTVSYTAKDKAGNETTPKIRTINVITKTDKDITAPVITLNGDENLTLEQGTKYEESGATATDDKDGKVNVDVEGSVDTTKVRTYVVTYTAVDKSGNEDVRTRIIKVILPKDTTPPVITLKGNSTLTLIQGTSYAEAGAIAIDERDEEVDVILTGNVDTSKVGTYTVNYTATDKAGNKGTKTRIVTVVLPPDTIPPVIKLEGANPMVIIKDSIFNDPKGIVEDNRDADVNLVVVGSVDTSTVGSYEIKYSATDSAGNKTEVVRVVNVVDKIDTNTTTPPTGGGTTTPPGGGGTTSPADNTPPVITLEGKKEITLHLGDTYVESGALAEDNIDGSIEVVIKGSVDTNKIGTYTIAYTAEDKAGNRVRENRTIIVTENTQASISGGLTGNASGVSVKHIGPGGGGAAFAMDFHPTNPNTMLFSGDIGMIYGTKNGGNSWNISKTPVEIRNLRYDAKNPNIVWGVGKGAYKSTDGGKNWKFIFMSRETLSGLALDPSDSNIAYVAEGYAPRIEVDWVHGKVWKTVDGGKTWKSLKRPGGNYNTDSIKNRNYSRIIVDPNSPIIAGEGHSRVYVVGRGGVFRSDDAGKNWVKLLYADTRLISDMELVNKNGKSTLFLAVIPVRGRSEGGIYKSTNNGVDWKKSNRGLALLINNLKKSYVNTSISRYMYSMMLTQSKSNPDRLYVGSWQGIYRSDDQGANWYEVTPREGQFSKDRTGRTLAVLNNHEHFKTSLWGGIDDFLNFRASQSNADILSFSDNQDMYTSKDGGHTWTSLSFDYTEAFDVNAMPELPAGAPANRYTHKTRSRGLQNLYNVQMQVDPFDTQTYYGAYKDVGLEISRDGGKSWEHATNGTPTRGHVWAVATDNNKEGRVYSSMANGHIYRSEDKGRTWKEVLNQSALGEIHDIKVDKNHNVYLATTTGGVYRSSDLGVTWKALKNGLPELITTIHIDPNNQNTLYAGTEQGLYVSIDQGEKWRAISQGFFHKVLSVTVNKKNNKVMYVVAHKPNQNNYWGDRDVWTTNDAGTTWTKITPNFIHYAGAVLVNPYDSNYLYVATLMSDASKANEKMILARSKDGGKSWENMTSNAAFRRGVNIQLDPKNAQHLLVSTAFSALEIIDNEAPKQ